MQDSDRSDMFGIPDALVGFDGRLPPSRKSASHKVTVGKIRGPLGDDAQPFVGGEWRATDASWSGQAFTTPSKENGKMGFITPELGDEPMKVVPEACAAFGSVMPTVSTFASFDVVPDARAEKSQADNIQDAMDKLSVAQVELQREIEAQKDENDDKLLTADAEMKKKAMAELKEEMDGNHLGHQDALKKLATTYKDIQSSLARHNLDLKSALRDAIVLIAVSISGHSRPMLVSVIDAELKLDANLRSQMLNAYHHIFRDRPPAFKSVADQRAGWRGKRRRKRRQAPEDALAVEETFEANDMSVEGPVPTSQVGLEAPFMPPPGLELDVCVMTDWIDLQNQDVIRFSF